MTQLAESLPATQLPPLTPDQQGERLADSLMAHYPNGTDINEPLLDRMIDLAGGDIKKAAGYIAANAVHWQQ